jgi:hypothetical protein
MNTSQTTLKMMLGLSGGVLMIAMMVFSFSKPRGAKSPKEKAIAFRSLRIFLVFGLVLAGLSTVSSTGFVSAQVVNPPTTQCYRHRYEFVMQSRRGNQVLVKVNEYARGLVPSSLLLNGVPVDSLVAQPILELMNSSLTGITESGLFYSGDFSSATMEGLRFVDTSTGTTRRLFAGFNIRAVKELEGSVLLVTTAQGGVINSHEVDSSSFTSRSVGIVGDLAIGRSVSGHVFLNGADVVHQEAAIRTSVAFNTTNAALTDVSMDGSRLLVRYGLNQSRLLIVDLLTNTQLHDVQWDSTARFTVGNRILGTVGDRLVVASADLSKLAVLELSGQRDPLAANEFRGLATNDHWVLRQFAGTLVWSDGPVLAISG